MFLSPAHPRFTRMYGVTHSTAFQALAFFRHCQISVVIPNVLFAILSAHAPL